MMKLIRNLITMDTMHTELNDGFLVSVSDNLYPNDPIKLNVNKRKKREHGMNRFDIAQK